MTQFILVFIEGLFSFFSPCILPILPLYFGYLSGNAKQVKEDGTVYYNQKVIFTYTFLFVLGISFAFFLLGFSFTLVGQLFEKSKYIISLICGMIIIVFGLLQLGIVKVKKLAIEKRVPFKLNLDQLSLFSTFILGFTFSFAWTPCVGPMLSSVLLLTASSTFITGFFYILVYTVGFILPFFILGIFTSKVLSFLKKNRGRLQNVVKVAGIILIIIGVSLIYQNGKQLYRELNYEKQDKIYDYALYDQFGNLHNLKEYDDKIIIVSFLDTRCNACKSEMKVLEQLYWDYQNNSQVMILGIMRTDNTSKEKIAEYLSKEDYHFPIVNDYKEELKTVYDVTIYPTTIIFNKDGIRKEQLIGLIDKDQLKNKIEEEICYKDIC